MKTLCPKPAAYDKSERTVDARGRRRTRIESSGKGGEKKSGRDGCRDKQKDEFEGRSD